MTQEQVLLALRDARIAFDNTLEFALLSDIPAWRVAKAAGVSRATAYRWRLRGMPTRRERVTAYR